jgi:hypothetical protein
MLKLRWGPAAFVVAALALFVALGGSGYALTQASSPQPASPGALAAVAPAWHALTLLNGWTWGFNSYHAAYYKDAQGVVHLRGSATGGMPYPLAVFRLPSGARPSQPVHLPVTATEGFAAALWIQPNGQATLVDPSPNGGNVVGFTSFDGVTFRVP